MNGFELMVWRKQRKVTQENLAKAFNVTRRTIVNWEAGRTRLPIDVAKQLECLAYTLMPKPIDVPPEWVMADERDRRPDLMLYEGKIKGQWIRGKEHPGMLLGDEHHLKRDGKWPWNTLDHPEYLVALKKWRATGQHSVPPREPKIMNTSLARNHWSIPKK